MLPNQPSAAWSPLSSFPRPQPQQADVPPTLIFAVADADAERFALDAFVGRSARTTSEVIAMVSRDRPAALVVDADLAAIDAAAICRAARTHEATSILVLITAPETAPALIKAGCHALLLKPFPPNLFAARIGRLVRERSQQLRLKALRPMSAQEPTGTHRTWPGIACPRCNEANAMGFEFSSYRRMWFACLACDQVWLGARPE